VTRFNLFLIIGLNGIEWDSLSNFMRFFRSKKYWPPLILVIAFQLCAVADSPSPSNTNTEPEGLFNLKDCIVYAHLHNPAIQAASQNWEAAIQKVPQARGWPDPRLNYGYFIQSVETRVGPQEQRFGIIQPLPWFGKLKSAGDAASSNAAAVLSELTALQLQMTREIKDTWYELAWIEEAQKTARENIALVSQLEGVARTRFKTGGTLGAVTKAQVELSRLQDRLASIEDMEQPLRARLNSLLGRPLEAPLPTPSLSGLEFASMPDKEQLFLWQKEANPLLEKYSHIIERESYSLRHARKQGMPEFGFGLDYIVTGDSRMSGTPDSGKDAALGLFSITIPLWRGKYKAAVAEAEARKEAADLAREDQANRLGSQLNMALYRFRDAERKMNLYGSTLLSHARSAMSVAQENYESGSGSFLDLLDSQRVLLDLELERLRAIANREQAMGEIEMLVGRELPARQ
jgi:outer membrane protein, heavy metal efflux system